MDEEQGMSDASLIIYDGECIYCQNYVRLVRLREAIGPVELLDARSGDPRIEAYWRQGYDLNSGMLFVFGGKVWHGADAVHMLARFSSERGLLNRLNARIFSSRGAAELLYPLLKLGRRVTLLLRGRRMLSGPEKG
jgi:predicted DCC family thiol-disulfide oxidoreductase YuxK